MIPPRFRRLSGLPPYGPEAVPIPAAFGRTGREGVVVELVGADGARWTGNFALGGGGVDDARADPDGVHVLVFAGGDAWRVDPTTRAADRILTSVLAVLAVPASGELVLDVSGLGFVAIGADGVAWRTRRLSWDGFSGLRLAEGRLLGHAWDALAPDAWTPFEVDLGSGAARGGAFADDLEGWERLRSR